MIIEYDYKPDSVYIPITLNVMIYKNEFSFKSSSYVNNDFIKYLCDHIKDSNKSYFIVDFSKIDFIDNEGLNGFNELFGIHKKNIIFCKINEKVKAFILEECSQHVVADPNDSTNDICSNDHGFTYYTKMIAKKYDEFINEFINNKIKKFLIEQTCEKDQFLPSSNVWANSYINTKRITNDIKLYYLVILKICNIIEEKFCDKFDKLVCVSYNGAVLATLISQIIKKEVFYLMNLGPHLSIKDKEIIKGIKAGCKYLFIADMICLGTEYKIAKTLIKLNNAELVGGISVVKYLDPDPAPEKISKNNIQTIIEIFDDDTEFKYKIYAKKEGQNIGK